MPARGIYPLADKELHEFGRSQRARPGEPTLRRISEWQSYPAKVSGINSEMRDRVVIHFHTKDWISSATAAHRPIRNLFVKLDHEFFLNCNKCTFRITVVHVTRVTTLRASWRKGR